VPDPLPVAVGAQERVLGDVLGDQPAPGEGVGQPHDGVVLADVEVLEPLGAPGRRGDAGLGLRQSHARPLLARHTVRCRETSVGFTRGRAEGIDQVILAA
jgi:hypothetical protein